jgi:hypothetical protein
MRGDSKVNPERLRADEQEEVIFNSENRPLVIYTKAEPS